MFTFFAWSSTGSGGNGEDDDDDGGSDETCFFAAVAGPQRLYTLFPITGSVLLENSRTLHTQK